MQTMQAPVTDHMRILIDICYYTKLLEQANGNLSETLKKIQDDIEKGKVEKSSSNEKSKVVNIAENKDGRK